MSTKLQAVHVEFSFCNCLLRSLSHNRCAGHICISKVNDLHKCASADIKNALQEPAFGLLILFNRFAVPGGLRITPDKCIKIERPGKPQNAPNTNTLTHCFYSHSIVAGGFDVMS